MGCSVDECDNRAVSRGYCDKHYKRWRKYGDPEKGARSQIKPCSVDGCPNPAEARTLCHGHYLSLLRRERMADPPALETESQRSARSQAVPVESTLEAFVAPTSIVCECTGDVLADVPIREVEGIGYISHGYRGVPVPSHPETPDLRGMPRSRASIDDGRSPWKALEPDEVVHHRNGVRTDNRIENLELWSVMQPKGQRIHDKVEYARELLRRYRPDLLRWG